MIFRRAFTLDYPSSIGSWALFNAQWSKLPNGTGWRRQLSPPPSQSADAWFGIVLHCRLKAARLDKLKVADFCPLYGERLDNICPPLPPKRGNCRQLLNFSTLAAKTRQLWTTPWRSRLPKKRLNATTLPHYPLLPKK